MSGHTFPNFSKPFFIYNTARMIPTGATGEGVGGWSNKQKWHVSLERNGPSLSFTSCFLLARCGSDGTTSSAMGTKATFQGSNQQEEKEQALNSLLLYVYTRHKTLF